MDAGDLFDWGSSQQVSLDTKVGQEWDGGATVYVIVRNTGDEVVSDWAVRWTETDQIDFFWDAEILVEDGLTTALPTEERNVIAPGEAVTFGFNVTTGPDGWSEPQFDFGVLGGDTSEPPDPSDPVDPPGPVDDVEGDVVTNAFEVNFSPISAWATGFSTNIAFANSANEDLTLTRVTWEVPEGLEIDFAWNADISIVDGMATAVLHDSVVKPGQAVSFGFNASHLAGADTDIVPVLWVLESEYEAPTEPPTDPAPADPAEPWDGTPPLNPIIGTQSIGPGYAFTDDGGLVETARAIEAMGSNIIKIALDPTLYGMSGVYQWQPVDLLTKNDAFAEVLQMDFDHYFFWLERSGPWTDNQGISADEYEQEYKVTYDLAVYLLETFAGTGKTFYIGNWETDWNLLEWNPTIEDVDDVRVEGLIDWINLRQAAIDQAKLDVGADGVAIYHYLEVNRVDDAQELGYERVVNQVLPNVNVDFVSYSAYDVILKEENIGRYDEALSENLDYIESLLQPKDGLPFEKRVFIGEFGFYLKYVTPEQQHDLSIDVLQASLEWGVPFALIWQMYDTSADEGLFLIGPDGEPTELYQSLATYNERLTAWSDAFFAQNGRVPSEEEVRAQAIAILAEIEQTAS